MNRQELIGAISLAFVYVLRMLGLFMVMPVIATLGQTYPDYSLPLVGIAIGGYGLTQALCQIPFGMLSDKLGRKPVIVAGLLLFCVGSLISAQAESLVWVVIGRLLQGTGAIASATMALAGDISRESQRPKVMAIIGIAIGFSFYLALFIGPFIATHWGLSGVFYTTAMLSALCVPLVVWVVPNGVEAAPSRDTIPQVNDLLVLVKNSNLVRLDISVFLLHIMITLVFIQLPTRFVEQGWALNRHWVLYLIVLVTSILGLAVLMRLAKKTGVKAGIVIAISLLIASFIGFVYLPASITNIVCATVIFFVGFNYLEANFPALVSSIAPAGQRGSAMGIFTSSQFLGAFCGGTLAGVAQTHLGTQGVFLLACGVCIGWLALVSGFRELKKLKRVVLSVGTSSSIQPLLAELKGQNGVYEVVYVQHEQACYLKVDAQEFDQSKARQLLS